MTAALLFLGTLLFGLLTCRLALRLACRLGLLDVPNERSSHERPTPRGGGLGILLALVPGAAAGLLLLGPGEVDGVAIGAIGAATLLLSGLGFLDDRGAVRPAVKALVQIPAAVLVVLAVGAVDRVLLPGVGDLHLSWLAAPLTVFWLVGFENGYNFMDGIDGIAGLHAGIAAMFLAAAGVLSGGGGTLFLALPLSGACLAFLSVNWPRARVFMGDAGSLPVGFLLATLVVVGARAGVPFATGFLILGPFLYDTMATIVRRIARRENLAKAHRSHLYQRLVILGWSHRRVSLLYGAWTLLTGCLGLMYLSGGTAVRGMALLGALLSGVGITVLAGRLEQRMSGDGRRT
jgi:UDP-N-acetylmuramyl pentapeptide phosphotransferase/UDP-N-acetylglucosamine-1-phosphate transferase